MESRRSSSRGEVGKNRRAAGEVRAGKYRGRVTGWGMGDVQRDRGGSCAGEDGGKGAERE